MNIPTLPLIPYTTIDKVAEPYRVAADLFHFSHIELYEFVRSLKIPFEDVKDETDYSRGFDAV